MTSPSSSSTSSPSSSNSNDDTNKKNNSSDKTDKTLSSKKSDADCYNCVGVYFFSDELKKLGKKPVCYGVEYKASKTIPPERMQELEQLPPIDPNTKTYLVGLSQSSTRMHRLGQSPLVKYGVQIVVSHQVHNGQEQQQGSIPSRRIPPRTARSTSNTPADENPNGRGFDPTISPPGSNKPAENREPLSNIGQMVSKVNMKSFEDFWKAYQKSCSKLWNTMGNVFAKSIDNFPERMYKGGERVAKGCDKMIDRTITSLKKIFGDSTDSK